MISSNNIKSINVEGLYYRYNLYHEFAEGINIIYGMNGTGKTTLLHILANVLNQDYSRFVYLPFKKIEVIMSDNQKITLVEEKSEDNRKVVLKGSGSRNKASFLLSDIKQQDSDDAETELLFEDELFPVAASDSSVMNLNAAYFPAFRAILEAWSVSDYRISRNFRRASFSSGEYDKLQHERLMMVTKMSRKLFGDFVPLISYPSLLNVQKELSDRVVEAQLRIAREDNRIVSKAFVDVIKALTPSDETEVGASIEKKWNDTIQSIKKFSDQLEERSIFTELSKVVNSKTLAKDATTQHILEVYRESLVTRVATKQGAFAEIDQYLNSVNQYLGETKKIGTAKVRGIGKNPVFIEYIDGSQTDLLPLSSGERQIVTMIYAATRMNKQSVILIDEPELSLHPDWQRKLLSSMVNQLGDRQIVVCTHSPIIGANYEERMNELKLRPYENNEQIKKQSSSRGGK